MVVNYEYWIGANDFIEAGVNVVVVPAYWSTAYQ
jgi:hypothetical protein